MKEITLIRHAKSDWGEEFLKDVDRYLSARGLRDAYYMSEWYAKNNPKPDLILSSTATRALSTALIFSRALELPSAQITLEAKIYEANVSTLYSVLRAQNEAHKSILMFGHNPGFTEMCNELSDDLYFDNLPTCAIASYQFDIKNWKDLSAKKGRLNYYEFPKNFKALQSNL
jgi:phosphohistidine phosphatase